MKSKTTILMISLVMTGVGLICVAGCSSDPGPTTEPSKQQLSFGEFPHTQKTGGQIWAENCSRCHNPRPATQYSAQQWEDICAHMRIRADLNGEEQRAVYHFMSGN